MPKSKIPHINHDLPRLAKHRLALVPIGLFMNRELQRAQIGDIVAFQTEWRIDRAILIRRCRIAVKSSIFAFMAKLIYGEHTRIDDIIRKWENLAILDGFGRDGIDREDCLLIEVKLLGE